jgi:antitoxin (DNA-binding transcriptional repressor) of toxin-antitoxin stability system
MITDEMRAVTLNEAKEWLAELVEGAARGEEVVMVSGEQPVAKLVPVTSVAAPPRCGSAKALIVMADDFDPPLDDFAGYVK